MPSLWGTHSHFLLHRARMICFLYFASVCFLSGLNFRAGAGHKVQEQNHSLSLHSVNYLRSPSPPFTSILFPRLPGTQVSSCFSYPLPKVPLLSVCAGLASPALKNAPSLFLSYSGTRPPSGLTTEHRLQKNDRRTPARTPAYFVDQPISLQPGDFGKRFPATGPLTAWGRLPSGRTDSSLGQSEAGESDFPFGSQGALA